MSLTDNVAFVYHSDRPFPCQFSNGGHCCYRFMIIARLVDFATEKIVTSVSRTCRYDGQGILPKSELFCWKEKMSFRMPKQNE